MLIAFTDAIAQYEVSRRELIRALQRRQLTRHEDDDGRVLLDVRELESIFRRPEPTAVPAPNPPIVIDDPRTVPTPDELESALQRVLSRRKVR